MKTSIPLLAILILVSAALAETSADKLYGNLEQRLQSLISLEIRYQAEGGALADSVLSGRMIWVKPDRFYHETPEWILCQTDSEDWRYLKTQKTLIRENARAQSEWGPETVLFHLGKNFRLGAMDVDVDGRRTLTLNSTDSEMPGDVILEFPPKGDTPDELDFHEPDGSLIHYRLTRWIENVQPDNAFFNPPPVPPANVIDFRGAGGSR
jgi:hypothetical protein